MNSSGRTGARAAHGHRVGVCSFSLVRDTKQYDSEESSGGRLFFYLYRKVQLEVVRRDVIESVTLIEMLSSISKKSYNSTDKFST